MDDTLPLFRTWFEEGIYGVGGEGGEARVDGRLRGFAWRGRVGQEDAVFARELLECYGYEGTYTANNKDLEWLVVVFA
jgi:hypothetical protein